MTPARRPAAPRCSDPVTIALSLAGFVLFWWVLAVLKADPRVLPAPPEVDWTDPSVSDAMRRFYLDSKRVSNARAKAELGWRPRYPTYREGLVSLL